MNRSLQFVLARNFWMLHRVELSSLKIPFPFESFEVGKQPAGLDVSKMTPLGR